VKLPKTGTDTCLIQPVQRRHQAFLGFPQCRKQRPANSPAGDHLLLGPQASLTGDQFNLSIVVSHKPVLEDSLKPPALGRLSGRNGGQFTSITYCFCYSDLALIIWLGAANLRTRQGKTLSPSVRNFYPHPSNHPHNPPRQQEETRAMDWNAAIGKNREALKRILATLVAMAGLVATGLPFSPCGRRHSRDG
jgi:hypothetical protein